MSVHAHMLGDKSLMKQQFVVTHRDTILQEKEYDRPSTDQHLIMLCF
jgi:hypothetical protein